MKRPEQLLDMATECRALAEAATTAEVREQLLDIAEQFERLAHGRRQGSSESSDGEHVRASGPAASGAGGNVH